MKIKLIDGSVYQVERAEVTNGRLEVDFRDKSAEEIQTIFTEKGNIANIELLTNDGNKFGEVPGFTSYGGVMVFGDIRTVILTKDVDMKEERLVGIETAILQLQNSINAEKKALQDTVDMLQECILEMSEKVYQ
ncbi:hypothetical protein AALA13_14390 [Lachnospiraceae bacterium 50-23]